MSAGKPTADKIQSIQYLRGLAALGVVFCHYGSNLPSHPKLSQIFNFGQTGVFLFFLISGFIIVYSLSKSNYKTPQFFTFLLKRSIRIDPSYYVVILLTLLLFWVLSFVPGYGGERMRFDPLQFISNLFYYAPFANFAFYNSVFWTLCVEFQFYILVGVFYFLSERTGYRLGFVILFSISSLFRWPDGYFVIFTYAPVFALGISLIAFYRGPTGLNAVLPVCLLAMVYYQFGLGIFILLLLSSLIMLYFKAMITPLNFLGNISYSLYLTHVLVYIVISGILKKLAINVDADPVPWLLVKVVFAILIAWSFYSLVEKPTLKFSKRFAYSKKPPGNTGRLKNIN